MPGKSREVGGRWCDAAGLKNEERRRKKEDPRLGNKRKPQIKQKRAASRAGEISPWGLLFASLDLLAAAEG
jgi:hypothetical protein